MADDSFLAETLKRRGRQSRVLDQTQALAGRERSFPVAPVQQPQPGEPVSPPSLGNDVGGDGGNGNGGNGGSGGGLSALAQQTGVRRPTFGRQPEQVQQATSPGLPELTGFNQRVDELFGLLNEDNFYARTGRQLTSSDKMLVEARKRFFIQRNRMPSKNELINELTRNVVSQVDNSAPPL